MLTATSPDWQAQLASDPEHERWMAIQTADDLLAFDDWLTTPEGQTWLDAEIEIDEERQVISNWRGW